MAWKTEHTHGAHTRVNMQHTTYLLGLCERHITLHVLLSLHTDTPF